ncbi:membrane metallo-endopeptidase-like 1 isoform X2 [Dermacentor albipictus]|uniref:membrane metallo-endopeptidase-like 1 isoform X2 n=1 Tax=Dermacentor albipictus TaxID=60249 RepID=UPI0031FD04AF
MARCPEHGEHKNHETSELSHRYRPNAYESYGSFYNTLSASGTPDGVSESLSDPVGNHVATAEGTSSSNAKLAVVAVAVALFIVFVVLLMRYGYPKAEKKDVPASGICDRESCLEYSQLLRASLADSLNPCHNFYAFVCHGARYPGGTDASILSLTRARLIDAVLEEWLRDNHTLREGRVPGKSLWAGKLLQMCVGQHESGADSSLAELQRFMLERNLTWPHANDSVGLANRDTLGTLVQLSLFWNVDVWFSLRVLEVSASAGRPTFRFGRSESYLEWEEKRKAFLKNNTYNRLLETFISAFGVSEAGHVKNIADRLRALEEEISGILATSPTRVRHSGPRVLKVSEMQPNGSSAHAFDWAAIIAEAFGTGTSEFANDAVVVKNSSLLNGVNTLLQLNANKANIYALVISWTVARDLGSFVHAGLSQAYGMTDRNVAERCILRLDQLTKPALTLPLFRRTLSDELLLRVRRVFHAVQDAAIEALDGNLWMDSGTKRRALFSARRIALLTRLPRASDLGDDEAELPRLDHDQSFFEAWRTAVEHMQAHLLAPRKGSPAELSFLSARPTFEEAHDRVVLHPASLWPPLFALDLPVAVLFAGIGQLLAHELMYGFHSALSLDFFDDVNGSDQWRPETIGEYKGRVACYLRSYGSYGTRHAHRQTMATDSADAERFSDFASAPVLYAAFGRRSIGGASSPADVRLPGLEATDARKLFFLAYCLTLCPAGDEGDSWEEAGARARHELRPEHRCNVPLMHMEEFASAFSCARDDDMNPQKKCSFW